VSFLIRRPVAGAATIAGKALAGLFFLIGKRRGSLERLCILEERSVMAWFAGRAAPGERALLGSTTVGAIGCCCASHDLLVCRSPFPTY
jgi:hypothetical protein